MKSVTSLVQHLYIYIYIIQILCVCVCVCLSSIGGQTAGPIMTKFGTYILYADRSGNGSYLKKKVPYGPEGWAHWGHSSKRVLSWRAANNPSRGSEPLAKQREEL